MIHDGLKYVFVTWILMLFQFFGYGQGFQFRQFNTDDGLPSNMVYEVKPDSKGFLWFCTDAGVSRFDGYNFVNYTAEDGLSDNEVFHSFEDSQGRVWFLTYNGKMSYYSKGQFYNSSNTDFLKQADGQHFLNRAYEDGEGNIWFGTENAKIIRISVDNEVAKIELDEIIDNRGKNNVLNFFEKDEKSILALTPLAYYEINKATFDVKLIRFITKEEVYKIGLGTGISLNTGLVADNYVIISYNNGFLRYNIDDSAFFSVHKSHKINSEVIYINYDGQQFWMGTRDGIYQFDNMKDLSANNVTGHLSGLQVGSHCVDRDGNRWFGTLGEGAFVKYGIDITARTDIPQVPVTAIGPSPEGRVTVGLENGSIWNICEHKKADKIMMPTTATSTETSTFGIDDTHYSIIKGIMWLDDQMLAVKGSRNFIRNQQNRALEFAAFTGTKCVGFSNDSVYLGTNIGFCVQPLRDQLSRLGELDQEILGIAYFGNETIDRRAQSRIYEIMFDESSNVLWLGTDDGLKLRRNDSIIHLNKTYKSLQQRITSIFKAPDGKIWVGTNGNGVSILTSEGKLLHEISSEDGLSSAICQTVFVDEDKVGWIATIAGLNRVEITSDSTISLRIIDRSDGLPVDKIKCIYVNKHSVWIGTEPGLIMFDKRSLNEELERIPVYVTEISASGISLNMDESNLTLSHNNNDVSIKFNGLSFITGSKIEYRYRLAEHSNWNYTQNTSIEFSNLSPSNYQFEVQAKNKSGYWSDQSAVVPFVISPPWWNTIWAYISYIVGGLLIAYSILQYELNRARIKSELQLEKMESGKYKEIERAKSLFFSNISHEIRTPLTLIQGPLEKILQANDLDDAKKYTSIAQRNANSLLHLVNDLLDLSKIDSEKLEIHLVHGNIISDIDAICQHFQVLAEKKGIDFFFESELRLFKMDYDAKKLEIILNNLLSNAIKFTDVQGSIKLTAKLQMLNQQYLTIEVIDTGIGIEQDKIPRLFERFYQADDSMTKEHQGSGIGLALTKKLVQLHHGTIKVSSQIGRGSIFTVTIPTKQPDQKNIQSKAPEFTAEPVEPPSTAQNLISEEKLKVLVVDDNEELRSYISYILPDKYQIQTAVNGEDGLVKSTEFVPDIIISDVMMPRMNGFEMCEKIRLDARLSHIPIILLTAKSSTDAKIEAFNAGADQYLSKPFNHDELNARVASLISQRKKLKERFSSDVEFDTLSLANSETDKKLLEKAVKVVEKNMENVEFDVTKFGREIGLSRTALHTKLKALTGQSTTQFIQSIRLKAAVDLMKNQGVNISEVSAKVGFNDPRYFSRSFKKMFGKSPSDLIVGQK